LSELCPASDFDERRQAVPEDVVLPPRDSILLDVVYTDGVCKYIDVYKFAEQLDLEAPWALHFYLLVEKSHRVLSFNPDLWLYAEVFHGAPSSILFWQGQETEVRFAKEEAAARALNRRRTKQRTRGTTTRTV
jgi:hypothetical protein